MNNLNGSNAYNMRSENSAAPQRRRKQPAKLPTKKHIRPNMTVRLNKKREELPVIARKPRKSRVRSLDDGEVRMIFAGGFAFFVLISLFVIIMRMHALDNELTLLIDQKKAELTALQNDYTGLQVKRDHILNDTTVYTYATNNLGMQKRSNHKVKWFEVSWDDDFDD